MAFSDIVAADSANVFLNAAEFAQTIEHWPAGVQADAVDVTAIVLLEEQEQFQGPRIDDRHGARELRFGRLELSTSITVDCDQRRENRDAFLIGGEIWQAERPIGVDGFGLQTIEISREIPVSTRTTRIGR